MKDILRIPLSIAPMLDKTNRWQRRFMRFITRETLLYSEMVTAPALLYGNRDKLLAFDPEEKPIVLQLGWDEPEMLAECCRIAEDYGYDEINLNCGCPSSKVQKHDFGASLMARPEHTAKIIEKMSAATSLPVTVKNRIGIRSKKRNISLEDYSDLAGFVKTVSQAGCRKFTVHSRIAVLEGLSPRDNREIPPLRPEDVYRLKEDFSGLFIEINGGYKTITDISEALNHTDAVMVGRAALDNPWLFAAVDNIFFGGGNRAQMPEKNITDRQIVARNSGERESTNTRKAVLEKAIPYLSEKASEGISRGVLVQPLMNLFAGEPGAKAWKRALSRLVPENSGNFESGLLEAVKLIDKSILEKTPELI